MIRKNDLSQKPERQRIPPPEIRRYSGVSHEKQNVPISAVQSQPKKQEWNTGRISARPQKHQRSASSERKFGAHGGSSRNAPQRGALSSSQEKRNDEVVRFVPLGGLEEIGRNCMFFEYKNEIVIIDMGLQFPEEEIS